MVVYKRKEIADPKKAAFGAYDDRFEFGFWSFLRGQVAAAAKIGSTNRSGHGMNPLKNRRWRTTGTATGFEKSSPATRTGDQVAMMSSQRFGSHLIVVVFASLTSRRFAARRRGVCDFRY